MRRWLIGSATNHRDFQRIDFHNYVNKEISFVGSKDIMVYARGKHTQLNNDGWVHPGIWTRQHDQCSNDDSISNRFRMKLQTNNFKAIGLLEVQNLHITDHLSVFWLETTRRPRKERKRRKILLYQELSRGGKITTTFLT